MWKNRKRRKLLRCRPAACTKQPQHPAVERSPRAVDALGLFFISHACSVRRSRFLRGSARMRGKDRPPAAEVRFLSPDVRERCKFAGNSETAFPVRAPLCFAPTSPAAVPARRRPFPRACVFRSRLRGVRGAALGKTATAALRRRSSFPEASRLSRLRQQGFAPRTL